MTCPPIPACVPCIPGAPRGPNQSGPDVPGTVCWIPEGCCLTPACNITEWDLICAVRALLPEGEIFINTLRTQKDPPEKPGSIKVGQSMLCQQLVLGDCCDEKILCDDDPPSPQLAVVDSYAAAVHGVIKAACSLILELDACTSVNSRDKWAKQFGIADEGFSEAVIAHLLCIWPLLQSRVWNMQSLEEVAALFGVEIRMYAPGDFSDCAPAGWWTMARDTPDIYCCPPIVACPPEAQPMITPLIRLENNCGPPPMSLNILVCPSDIVLPLCGHQRTIMPHNPELYDVFKNWLLPKVLPQPAFYCVYDADPDDCIRC